MIKLFSKVFGGKRAPRVFTVDDEIRIVLIGKTGVGKSETGNSILGKDEFEAQDYATSVTKVCGFAEVIRGDKKIILVDTPGLFDTKVLLDETKEEVAKCVVVSAPGVHCFLLILQIGRFSPEEKQTIEELRRLFGENADRYLIVLFTKIDMLKGNVSDEEKFQKYLENIPQDLQEFLNECDMRCIGFNNRADGKKKKKQVEKLFKMIDETLSKNGGTFYTNEMYQETERKIKEAIDMEREEEEKRARDEEEKLRQQIENEKLKEHKEKLEEGMIKLQKQHEAEKQRQEEEIRRQIRDKNQKSYRIVEDLIVEDFLKNMFLKKEPKYYAVEDEIRITLLGKTGAGKSETGNTLLGKEYFVAKDYGTTVTRNCCLGEVIRGKKKIVVVDTPGLYDTEISKEESKKEIAKCIGLTLPGPHCFLVVIQVGRFTSEEHQTVKDLMQLFGNEAHRYIIVIFTKIDSLGGGQSLSGDKKFENYIKKIPEDLHNFLVFCGNRYIGFNNNQPFKKRDQQVDQLLQLIQDTVTRNGGRFYSNEMYEESERMIHAKMLQIAKEREENLRLQIEKENKSERKKALENEVKRLEKDNNVEELRRKVRSEIEKETGTFWDTLWPYLKMGLMIAVQEIIKAKLGVDVATITIDTIP